MDEEVRTFGEVMVPVFDILLGRIRELHLCQILLYSYLDMLLYFTRQKDIAQVSTLLSSPRGARSSRVNCPTRATLPRRQLLMLCKLSCKTAGAALALAQLLPLILRGWAWALGVAAVFVPQGSVSSCRVFIL